MPPWLIRHQVLGGLKIIKIFSGPFILKKSKLGTKINSYLGPSQGLGKDPCQVKGPGA
jgi:hypothetical protein